ncbi:MAG: hypothetical protein R3B09_22850 [Nannocystaceae bacterium]
MNLPVSTALTQSLPALVDSGAGPTIDVGEVQSDLEAVAREALEARRRGLPLIDAFEHPDFPELRVFHSGLRDALFLEIPRELEPWVKAVTDAGSAAESAPLGQLQRMLVDVAQGARGSDDPEVAELQAALAELLVFEALRLQLLILALGTDEFELLGGEESDVDAVAWAEVEAMLHQPFLRDPEIRPLHVLRAGASVALARESAERAEALRLTTDEYRDEVHMRARLRAALRELRLPEAVLLENALASLLGGDRRELLDLQAERPVALDGLSRQAMDQRVSRGRRALTRARQSWPQRRRPALFDLLRAPKAAL